MQRVLRLKFDRIQQEVELAPLLPDVLEHLLHLPFDGDIEWQEDRSLQILGERLDMLLRLLVQIGDRQLSAQRAKSLGAAPGNRLVVGDADDQSLASLERNLGLGKYGDIHDAFSLAWVDGRLLHSSARVCCAIISSSSVGTT